MKILSIVMLVLLTSCSAFVKHKDDLKPMAHDMVDEAIDEVVEVKEEHKEEK